MDNFSILGLLQKFEHMIGYRAKKFYTITNCEFIIGGVASTYRKDVIKKLKFYDSDTVTEDIGLSLKIVSLGNYQNRIVYGADVIAMTEAVQSFKALLRQRYRWKLGSLQNLYKHSRLFLNNDTKYSRMLTWYRIPMAFIGEFIILMEPFLMGYIIYLTWQIGSPVLYAIAYATITLYVLWNVWPDEHSTLRQKLQLTVYAPAMYFLFFIMNLVQLVAILRCLINYRQILGFKTTAGHWISAERTGQPVARST